MTSTLYSSPLVWFGIWKTPTGINLEGFHVWNRFGIWHGVYKTCSRAGAEVHQMKEN